LTCSAKTRPSEQAFVSALKRRHVSWAMRARQRARRSSFSLLVSKGRPPTVKAREDDHLGDLLTAGVRVAWQRMPTAAVVDKLVDSKLLRCLPLSTLARIRLSTSCLLSTVYHRLPLSTRVDSRHFTPQSSCCFRDHTAPGHPYLRC